MQEKSRKEAHAANKAAKKLKTGDTAAGFKGGAGDAAGKGQDWPWRPFDRERDLDIKPKAKSGSEIVRGAAALGSKFSGGGTQRQFL